MIGDGVAVTEEVNPIKHSNEAMAGVIDDGDVSARDKDGLAPSGKNAAVVDQGASGEITKDGVVVPGYHGDVVSDGDSNVVSAVVDRVPCRRRLVGGDGLGRGDCQCHGLFLLSAWPKAGIACGERGVVRHQDLEIGVSVAVDIALDDDVAPDPHGMQLALHVVEGLSPDEMEGLVARDSRLGVDGAEVDKVAGDVVGMGEIEDRVAMSTRRRVGEAIEIENVAAGTAQEPVSIP
jgi:hypothetical protein